MHMCVVGREMGCVRAKLGATQACRSCMPGSHSVCCVSCADAVVEEPLYLDDCMSICHGSVGVATASSTGKLCHEHVLVLQVAVVPVCSRQFAQWFVHACRFFVCSCVTAPGHIMCSG
jgi:hypothetical protein